MSRWRLQVVNFKACVARLRSNTIGAPVVIVRDARTDRSTSIQISLPRRSRGGKRGHAALPRHDDCFCAVHDCIFRAPSIFLSVPFRSAFFVSLGRFLTILAYTNPGRERGDKRSIRNIKNMGLYISNVQE